MSRARPRGVPGSTSVECSPPVGKMPGNGPIPTAKRGDQQQAQPPLRHRVERQRGAGRVPVEPPAAVPAADDAEVDADDHGQERRGADEQQRRPDPVGDQVGHRHPVAQRDAQLAGEGVLQEGQELLRQRLVEAVGVPELRRAAPRSGTGRGPACGPGPRAAPGTGRSSRPGRRTGCRARPAPCRRRSGRSSRAGRPVAAAAAATSVVTGRSLALARGRPRRTTSSTPAADQDHEHDAADRSGSRVAAAVVRRCRPRRSSGTAAPTPRRRSRPASSVGRSSGVVVRAVLHQPDAARVRLRLEAGEPVAAEGLARAWCRR